MAIQQQDQTAPAPQTQDDFVCPITYMLDLLSAKWTIEILRELYMQPVRSRRFLSFIPGMSMKALSERLHVLADAGIIDRVVLSERPPAVEYRLSGKGHELYHILMSLKMLGSRWLGNKCDCSMEHLPGSGCEINCPRRRPPTLSQGSTQSYSKISLSAYDS